MVSISLELFNSVIRIVRRENTHLTATFFSFMNNSATRKQEIYDKIKESSKDEFILSEMKRLGFWGDNEVDFEKANAFLKEERVLIEASTVDSTRSSTVVPAVGS